MLPSLMVVFPHFGRKFAASQTLFFPMDYKQDDIRHPAIGCCGRSFIPINSWDQCHLSFSRCPRLFRLRPIICRWRIAIGKCEKYIHRPAAAETTKDAKHKEICASATAAASERMSPTSPTPTDTSTMCSCVVLVFRPMFYKYIGKTSPTGRDMRQHFQSSGWGEGQGGG